MKIDEAREFLKEKIKEERCDFTFDNYIDNVLAGDFAVEVAEMFGWEYEPEYPVIRPEKAGELWKIPNQERYYHTELRGGDLIVCDYEGYTTHFDSIVHNQNGWTRIHPPVEEDVERVVIEGVRWHKNPHGFVYPEGIESTILDRLVEHNNKPPTKMTIEFPKEN